MCEWERERESGNGSHGYRGSMGSQKWQLLLGYEMPCKGFVFKAAASQRLICIELVLYRDKGKPSTSMLFSSKVRPCFQKIKVVYKKLIFFYKKNPSQCNLQCTIWYNFVDSGDYGRIKQLFQKRNVQWGSGAEINNWESNPNSTILACPLCWHDTIASKQGAKH